MVQGQTHTTGRGRRPRGNAIVCAAMRRSILKDFYRRFACFWAAGRALGVRYRKHALWAGSNVLCCHEGTAVYKFLFLFLKIGRVMKIKNDLLTSP